MRLRYRKRSGRTPSETCSHLGWLSMLDELYNGRPDRGPRGAQPPFGLASHSSRGERSPPVTTDCYLVLGFGQYMVPRTPRSRIVWL